MVRKTILIYSVFVALIAFIPDARSDQSLQIEEAVRQFVDTILRDIPVSRTIRLDEIQSTESDLPETENALIEKISGILAIALIDAGYTVTRVYPTDHAVQIYGRLDVSKTEEKRSLILNLTFQTADLTRSYSYSLLEIATTKNRLSPILFGEIAYLAGGEIESFDPGDEHATHTSTVNERDIMLGVKAGAQSRVQATAAFRTRSSFGQDRIEVERAHIQADFDRISLLSGIYRLRPGHGSRYLNATVQRPYWKKGLIFDSRVSGLRVRMNRGSYSLEGQIATNRNPSAVAALRPRICTDKVDLSLIALYVNRDDQYNDTAYLIGSEATYRHDPSLFFYAAGSHCHYHGKGVNIEREIDILFSEYDWNLTRSARWRIHGAYLAIIERFSAESPLDGNSRLDQTFFQAIEFLANKSVTVALDYERFDIGDFYQTDVTARICLHPDPNGSLIGIPYGKIILRARAIFPEIGRKTLFFGVEGQTFF
ncbi:MAG: hypothetical protein B6244_06120 [Candidatus Cloacimonetes bacterium 4572_55]|nr:MAG: hypothetical protein B6244_06120 [Candidatus Cloacimonetes bacterium 4572_55]